MAKFLNLISKFKAQILIPRKHRYRVLVLGLPDKKQMVEICQNSSYLSYELVYEDNPVT